MSDWLEPAFERQYWDTESAWNAFLVYRGLPPSGRSTSVVAEAVREDLALVNRWAYQFHWSWRAEQYWEQFQKKSVESDQGFDAQRGSIVGDLRELVQREVATLLARSRQFAGRSNVMTPSALIRLCDRVLQLEQVHVLRAESKGVDMSALPDEELVKFIETIQKVNW